MINIQNNVNIKNYTSIKIGGIVKYFIEISSEKEIIEAFKFINENKLKYIVLGNGSNVLINDKYFDGCVVRINKRYNFFNIIDTNKIEVSSGYLLSTFINKCRENNLSSLEQLYGIPGTIGGCIHGNAGIPTLAIGDNVDSVKVLYRGKIMVLSKDDCMFTYRNSLFKNCSDYIILSAIIIVKKVKKEIIDDIIIKTIKHRKYTQPIDKYSCGCIFKNIGNINSWKYIKSLNLSDFENKKAYVSDLHSSFIINGGEATFKDIYNLIETIKNSVYYIYNIMLCPEVEIIDWR